MNPPEHDEFETELRQLRPARLPNEFAARLAAARPVLATQHSPRSTGFLSYRSLIRWLAPVAAAASVILLLWWKTPQSETAVPSRPALRASDSPAFRADDVEIGRRLVGAFDAIATLPNGEPVRVRCQEWMDELVLRDTGRGMAIEQRTPRFEIVPVSFETF